MDDPASFTCPVTVEGGVSLKALDSVGQALAEYRDAMAATYDYRFASFGVEVEVLSGIHGCELRLGASSSSDGSAWWNFTLGGEKQRAEWHGWGKPYVFPDPAHTDYLARCFTPR